MSLQGSGTRTSINYAAAATVVSLGLALFFSLLLCCGCGSQEPAIVKAAPAVAVGPAPSSVTFVVTGGRSDVDYGTSNVNLKAVGPMQRSMAAKDYHGFTLTAVLRHAGHIVCRILIGGKIVTTSHGSDSAICAVTQDPGTGNWVSLSR